MLTHYRVFLKVKCPNTPSEQSLYLYLFGGAFLLVVFVLANIMAWQQKQNMLYRKGAIVTASSITVKGAPAKNGTDLFILHEGTKVIITDDAMKAWKKIRLADGKEGWIETKQIELI